MKNFTVKTTQTFLLHEIIQFAAKVVISLLIAALGIFALTCSIMQIKDAKGGILRAETHTGIVLSCIRRTTDTRSSSMSYLISMQGSDEVFVLESIAVDHFRLHNWNLPTGEPITLKSYASSTKDTICALSSSTLDFTEEELLEAHINNANVGIVLGIVCTSIGIVCLAFALRRHIKRVTRCAKRT